MLTWDIPQPFSQGTPGPQPAHPVPQT